MSKKIRTVVVGLMIAFGLVAAPVAFGGVSYAANKDEVCQGVSAIQNGGGASTDCSGVNGSALGDFLKKIINILLFIIGAIAVIMIIIGGIRYVTSAGDQGAVTGAKNTILYAVIGLVVAVMAFAIVNFVLKSL